MSAGQRIAVAAAAAYLLVGLMTFGHSAARTNDYQAAHCATYQQRYERGGACIGGPAFTGAFAAVLWPFYWSWEAWS